MLSLRIIVMLISFLVLLFFKWYIFLYFFLLNFSVSAYPFIFLCIFYLISHNLFLSCNAASTEFIHILDYYYDIFQWSNNIRFFLFLRWSLALSPRLEFNGKISLTETSASWVQVILPSQPPKQLGLQVQTTVPS